MSDLNTTSRYRKIYQTIYDEIVQGNYKPGDKLPTGTQLCARFKVARATVGRAITKLEQDGLIRRRQGSGIYIQEVDRSCHIKPTLAFFAPFVQRNEELPHVESLIVRHLAELAGYDQVRLGFHCLSPHKGTTEDQFRAATATLLDSKPDGVLYYPAALSKEKMQINALTVQRLISAGCKVVLIDRELDISPYCSQLTRIGYDNVRGGILLVNHLVSRECQRIAFVGLPLGSTSVEDRLIGYWTGLRQNGVRAKSNLVFEPKAITRQFCERLVKSKPDAVICYADRICARIGQHFSAMGIQIGKDIKMAGFDDDPIASLLPVPLTTIRLPASSFAKAAYDALNCQIESNQKNVRQILIGCELVVRESTS